MIAILDAIAHMAVVTWPVFVAGVAIVAAWPHREAP